MGTYLSFIGQTFPPAPALTEKNLADQTGKVFIVTGATSGVGKALAEILYSHNAKVYIGARSPTKAAEVIQDIKSRFPASSSSSASASRVGGDILYLHLDLGDLSTIKASAQDFLSKEDRLDVLWNNAGVMGPVPGQTTAQGYELQLGTNTVAPFLFTKLLTPILTRTAQSSPPASVRVVWVSSSAAELLAPRGGLDLDNLDYEVAKPFQHIYGVSKAGNVLHSKEFARLYKSDGIVSLSLNPGNLKTGLQKNLSPLVLMLTKMISYEPIWGAYTELFAGLAPEITIADSGAWIIPWGRIAPIRQDYEQSAKTIAEGGTGIGEGFWKWSEEQVRPYL